MDGLTTDEPTRRARLRRRWTELDRGWQAVVFAYLAVGVVVLTV